MCAVVVERFGPLPEAKIDKTEPTEPGPDEVMVYVEAARLNYSDIPVIKDNYQVALHVDRITPMG